MAGSKGRKLSKDFKESISKLIVEGQRPVTQVCQEHGLAPSMVYEWLKQIRIDAGQGQPGELTSQEHVEFVQLRRRLKEVEMENSFLKKSTNSLWKTSSKVQIH